MSSHKLNRLLDIVIVIMAYLIFAISLLAVNIIKYPVIKVGLYFLLIVSSILVFYGLLSYYKGANNKN